MAEWDIITYLWLLYYYCGSSKLVIIPHLNFSTLVIQQPQMIIMTSLNTDCVGPILVRNQIFLVKIESTVKI